MFIVKTNADMKLNRIFQFSGCMTILVMVVGGAGLVGNVIAVIVLSRWSS